MYTYIIESQGLHKIGKAEDINNRMADYRTHNPVFNLLRTIAGDYEKELHKKFNKKRSHLEWYNLNDGDVEKIDKEYQTIVPEKIEKQRTEKVLLQVIEKYLEYNTNEFYLNVKRKEELVGITGLKFNTISQCLTRLVKKNLLIRVSNSTYQMNPLVFFKGEDIERAKYLEMTIRYEICPKCGIKIN